MKAAEKHSDELALLWLPPKMENSWTYEDGSRK